MGVLWGGVCVWESQGSVGACTRKRSTPPHTPTNTSVNPLLPSPYLADVVGEPLRPLLRQRGVEQQVQVRVRVHVLRVWWVLGEWITYSVGVAPVKSNLPRVSDIFHKPRRLIAHVRGTAAAGGSPASPPT